MTSARGGPDCPGARWYRHCHVVPLSEIEAMSVSSVALQSSECRRPVFSEQPAAVDLKPRQEELPRGLPGLPVFGEWWTNWAIMIMPPGAFFMLAVFIWIVKGVFLKPKEEGK